MKVKKELHFKHVGRASCSTSEDSQRYGHILTNKKGWIQHHNQATSRCLFCFECVQFHAVPKLSIIQTTDPGPHFTQPHAVGRDQDGHEAGGASPVSLTIDEKRLRCAKAEKEMGGAVRLVTDIQ